ncbi:uncharacterized protein OCT59_007814 [Rhizophagus irregularis]|nr:hypothetical protein OCT59_007814 [Rhizophagus irregularis]
MHYNLVGVSTGYKRIQGKLTEIPAIILYVRQKGILRRECDKFLDEIREYPVDVVEAYFAIPYGYGVTSCQAYQKDVGLRSSIGITESQGTSGTLSAVVRDKKSGQMGILSCEHVCKFCESSTGIGTVIHQPSHKDLDNLIQSFVELEDKNLAFKKISEDSRNMINNDRQNLAITCYECEFKNFDDEFGVFKVGRATGLTLGKYLLIDSAISIDLTNESIKFAKFAEEQGEQGQIPLHNSYHKEIFIGYMKSPLIQEIDKKCQKCYPTVWFDQQLVFKFNCEDFEPEDSGASVADKKGRALGILHAAWVTENFRYAIASLYFAVFETLDVVEIME